MLIYESHVCTDVVVDMYAGALKEPACRDKMGILPFGLLL